MSERTELREVNQQRERKKSLVEGLLKCINESEGHILGVQDMNIEYSHCRGN